MSAKKSVPSKIAAFSKNRRGTTRQPTKPLVVLNHKQYLTCAFQPNHRLLLGLAVEHLHSGNNMGTISIVKTPSLFSHYLCYPQNIYTVDKTLMKKKERAPNFLLYQQQQQPTYLHISLLKG